MQSKKRVAIMQSNYIPWKGYFDIIGSVDELIVYDDMQYTRRDWRNRNKIKTPNGLLWLTVPVLVKGKFTQSIRSTLVANDSWQREHWKSLLQFYGKARRFDEVADTIEPLYLNEKYSSITSVNIAFIRRICRYLDIKTEIKYSWEYDVVEGKNQRLLSLCQQAGASEYVSGPAAKGYIDEALFQKNGVNVLWFDYGGYPEYEQLWGEFKHEVSILDLLFNCGSEAARKMQIGLHLDEGI